MNNDTLYFVAKFALDGAAFEDGQGAELARVLREMADDVESWPVDRPSFYQSIRDENGNTVGRYGIKYKYHLDR